MKQDHYYCIGMSWTEFYDNNQPILVGNDKGTFVYTTYAAAFRQKERLESGKTNPNIKYHVLDIGNSLAKVYNPQIF